MVSASRFRWRKSLSSRNQCSLSESDAEQRRKLDTKLKESKKFVAEEKKEISEYFVICLHCQSINRILHPQWVKQSQCSQCNTPFIITKK